MIARRALGVLLAASGWLGPTTHAASPPVVEALDGTRPVVIVAVEAPPLFMDSSALAKNVAKALGLGTEAAGSQGIPVVTAAGPVVTLLSALVGAAGAARDARSTTALTADVDYALSAGGTWLPTRSVAATLASECDRRGIHGARVRDGVVPIPGVTDRGITLSMRNWYAPLKSYYASPTVPLAWEPGEVENDAQVLEVSIGNYEIGRFGFVLLVRVQLVDPNDGRVLARGEGFSRAPLTDKVDALFADGGRDFKIQFAALSNEALLKALGKMRLPALSPAAKDSRSR